MAETPAVNLRGLRVWVTRSEPQAYSLCVALQAAGAVPIAVPTLAILGPEDAAAARDRLRTLLAAADVAVFSSRNAVDWAARLSDGAPTVAAATRVLAVGPATAAELRQRGITEVLTPPAGADSEALLAMPLLAGEQVHGRRVVIVRGHGGRALLGETLRARGALVDYTEVYRRTIHAGTQEQLPALWREQPPQAIVASSPAGLRALIDMTGSAHRQPLYDCPLLAIGDNLARQAVQIGFRACHPVPAAGGAAAVLEVLAQLSNDTMMQ